MPAFEARLRDFEAAGAQVVGISTDSIYSHQAWAKSLGGITYPLLADIHRDVVKRYGLHWPELNASAAVGPFFVRNPMRSSDRNCGDSFKPREGLTATSRKLSSSAKADDSNHHAQGWVGEKIATAAVAGCPLSRAQ